MRPLEVTLLLINLPLLAWCFSGRAIPMWGRALSFAVVLVMVAHVVLEGARWHLVPVYITSIGFAAVSCWPYALVLGRWPALVGLPFLIASGTVATILPVFTLPRPTGMHPIGTVILHLVDTARKETLGDRAGGPRELMIQIWYPADHAGPVRRYRPHGETEFKKRHLSLVKTHAALSVPVATAQARYPVVIFEPAWTGRRDQNTVQVEELASHGFIVVGIDRPYSTALTVFPDGRRAETVLRACRDYSTEVTFQKSLENLEVQLQLRAADVRFVLDELERLNAEGEGLVTERLDLSHVGIFGHSFGGAVAAEMCATDVRFKAGVSLDGEVIGTIKSKPIGKPFMVFNEDVPVATAAQIARSTGPVRRELASMAERDRCIRLRLSESGGCLLTIRGAAHMNFCDSPLYSPIRRLTLAGRIPPLRCMEIINAYVVAFLQSHLNGCSEPLLEERGSPYTEVEFERFPDGGA